MPETSPVADKFARAAEIERQLASGARLHPDTIAELLESDDEDLGLLASYLLAGREEQMISRAAQGPLVALRRLARRHAAELLRHELPARVQSALEEMAPSAAVEAARALPESRAEGVPASMTIVVHGAFAAGDSWWRPTGGFGRYVHEQTGDLYRGADFFRWSGGGFHPDRVAAAHALAAWARQHPAAELDVISHSHGGNVCFLATRLGLRIRKLISLATPICLDYLPDMRRIGILHNVISLADIIQGPASYIGVHHRGDGRTLADSRQVINHLATMDGDGRAPSHSELHDPETFKASGLEDKLFGPASLA